MYDTTLMDQPIYKPPHCAGRGKKSNTICFITPPRWKVDDIIDQPPDGYLVSPGVKELLRLRHSLSAVGSWTFSSSGLWMIIPYLLTNLNLMKFFFLIDKNITVRD